MILSEIGVVALFGALGSVLRFLVSNRTEAWLGADFPYGILIVNALGSLMIGCLVGYFDKHLTHSIWRMGLIVGLMGGFTTFSSFSMDNIRLLMDGNFMLAMVNIAASLLLGLGLCALGYIGVRQLV